jgi:hypothetical protein
MRKLLLGVMLIGFSITLKAQDSYLQNMQAMLQQKNNQYNTGEQSVYDAYQKLINLQLINKDNEKILVTYQENVKKYAYKMDNVDYSIPANVNWALNFINKYITDNKSIKDEMNLLGKISLELQVLKNNNPTNWTTTTRYKELMDILVVLESCNPGDINSLGWKHGIL